MYLKGGFGFELFRLTFELKVEIQFRFIVPYVLSRNMKG